MRPLEERFPTLYWNIVHEQSPKSGKVEEKRTAKETAPTLFNVVEVVCSMHRVTDVGLMKDLAATIAEFTAPPKTTEKKKTAKETE